MISLLEQLLSSNQQQFISTALSQGIRTDGRTAHIYRNIKISIVNTNTVEISLDGTLVICTVQCSIVTPLPERGNDGMIYINCNYTTLINQYNTEDDTQYNKNIIEYVVLDRLLNRIFRESNMIDTESLCILSCKKVWSINLTCNIINNNGNIIDCTIYSIMACLLLCRRNDVSVIGDRITIHPLDDRTPVALTLHHIVSSCTYCVINKQFIIVDPNSIEQQLADSIITIVINNNNDICYLHKPGGCGIATQQLIELSNQSLQHITSHIELLRGAVYEYMQKSVNKYKQSTTKPVDAFGSNIQLPSGLA